MSSNGPPAASVIKSRMQALNKDIDRLKDEVAIRDKIIIDEGNKRSEIDEELRYLRKKIESVETERNQFEMKFKEANETLGLINKDANNCERYRKVMENRQNADIDRIEQLETQIKSSLLSTEETNKRYEELLKKVSLSEHLLERSESRCLFGENRMKQLDSDLKAIITKLKFLENQRDQAIEREINYENGIKCLMLQVKEAEERALAAEKDVSKRDQEINSLKEEMEREKTNFHYIKKELDKLHEGYFGL